MKEFAHPEFREHQLKAVGTLGPCGQFSPAEVRFLTQPHQVEYAAGCRSLGEIVDVRAIGCPSHIFARVLEDRAKKLGAKFSEFRSSQRAQANAAAGPSLEDEIQGSKFF